MSPSGNGSRWPGCHGVRVGGDPVALGVASGTPLLDATVQFGSVTQAEGRVLWTQRAEVVVDGATRVVHRGLTRLPDGRLLLSGTDGPAIEIDPRVATIVVGGRDEIVHRQLIAAFALPLLLHELGVLVVHGAACARGDEAVLVCGASGAGKSSTLVRLVDAGWRAVSEDTCAIDLDAPGGPVVWPGPAWVRVKRGEPGPRTSTALYEQTDKTVWDLASLQTTAATRLTRVVVLDAPGGTETRVAPVTSAQAIALLAKHAVWLGEQDARARHLFAPVAALAARVATFRLQLPRDEQWRDALPELFASSVFAN